MRRLVLKMSMSLDGFVGGSNGEIDWLFRSRAADSTAWVIDTLWSAGLHLMGNRTFRDMSAWWPSSTDPVAAPMNEIPKVAFSRGSPGPAAATLALRDAAEARTDAAAPAGAAAEIGRRWRETPILTGPLTEEIARLKAQPGKDLLAHGGASFARSLASAALIDEYRLLVHPVVLGRGLPLFADLPVARDLQLIDTRSFTGGAVALVYRPIPAS
jgi:dihydrofolate reductase